MATAEHSSRPRGPEIVLWVAALAAAIAPLWAAWPLPQVDLPQHLYIIDVIRRLHDPSTLYPQYFGFHQRFGAYSGYYTIVGLLLSWLPTEVANRVFLSLTVIGLPLSVALLLRSLGRPVWPALLVVPLSYGDSFAWGFVNTGAALPLAIASLAAFTFSIVRARRRIAWAAVLALGSLGTFVMHPLHTGFLALAIPWLLLTTRSDEDPASFRVRTWLRPRLPALLALVPVAILAAQWAYQLASRRMTYAPGVPHHAWGAMLAAENLRFMPPLENLQAMPFLLADLFMDGSDALALALFGLVGLVALLSRFFEDPIEPPARSRRQILRPLGLVAIAAALFLWLPIHIQGYINYLNPRYAPLVACMAVACMPRLGRRSEALGRAGAVVAAIFFSVVAIRGFRAFAKEASALESLARLVGDRPRIMGLIFDTDSRSMRHPVFVHAAASLARARGGLPNRTFAGGSQIPVYYRSPPPATMPSEWQPGEFRFSLYGADYDHFLIRGAPPESVLGAPREPGLRVAGRIGEWSLVRRDSVPR